MEQLSRKIAKKISTTLHYEQEQEEVIAYGLIAIVQIIVTLFLVSLFGLIFHVFLQALIVTMSVSILRKYSGGSHASSIEICTASAVIYSVGSGLIIRYFLYSLVNMNVMIVLTFAIFISAYWIINKKAPVDSPNKPIKSASKIRRMRTGSFIVLTGYLLINALLIYFAAAYSNATILNQYSLSLLFGILWQTSTLTAFSAKIAEKISTTVIR